MSAAAGDLGLAINEPLHTLLYSIAWIRWFMSCCVLISSLKQSYSTHTHPGESREISARMAVGFEQPRRPRDYSQAIP